MERDAASTERRVRDLLRRCREAGMNVTPQRIAIYRALLEAEDHPAPEALYRRVHPGMPSLSLATVYKTLETLRRLGVVAEVSPVAARRYDANTERHHHLVCKGCGKVADYYDSRMDSLRLPRRLDGFRPQEISVQILGLCAECAGRRPERSQRQQPA